MSTKESNPKDNVGIKKWRQFTTIPLTVMCELGVAMLEGHKKGYGRHNYRVAGVKASVYVDAAVGHIMQWWEGEDIDADSQLSHITKAISSLVVLRDAMIQQQLNDDRPPKAKLDEVRDEGFANTIVGFPYGFVVDRLDVVLGTIAHTHGNVPGAVVALDALDVPRIDAGGLRDLDESHRNHHFLPFAASRASFLWSARTAL